MKNFFNIIHGANPENLYRAFNITIPQKIIDFSTNTNILTWSGFEIDIENLASNYPDSDCKKLRKLISEREKISPERILFTNGINEAIFLLANLKMSEETAIFQPCYSEYSRAFRNAENIFNLEEAGNFKNFIITNPNNPNGIYTKNLSLILKKFPETFFIIDEAYIDFLIHDEPERLCDFKNAIILRSLTKIFHLSGVRIGYVIADEKIIEALKNLQPTWSVNAVAQELAWNFLNDKTFYDETKNFYKKHTPEFIEKLRHAGFEIENSSVHYFLLKADCDFDLIKNLLKFGIVVRHTRNFPGLDGKYIRIATRFSDENDFLIQTLDKI